ncbi:acetolactate synthase AlsS [Microbacterium sp. W1N]|uniref:acetolactate synthase AlsS n=1 Tax=Microbacterium festucae TaxID=2977531 RepID=UPI0021BDF4C4|nr:acetolactate synthase AlsS [Microbacterium festucae]MCT9821184.1 acetolactate synthase AlsS [Microbacterium festucae]
MDAIANAVFLAPRPAATMEEPPHEGTPMTLLSPDAPALAHPAPLRSADHIVAALRAQGVRWVFGVPGAKIDPVFDALAAVAGDVTAPQLVTCRNEQSAAFMAAAIGRLTGIPGVALVTSGPGTTNLVTGLVTATTEGDPMVAICGAVSRAEHLKRTHQSMDAVGLLSAVTKSAVEVTVADNVAEAVTDAFRTALREPRGAAAVVLPYDVSIEPTSIGFPVAPATPRLGAAHPESLLQAAELIRAARFPVVLAGARSGADRVVRALHTLLGHTDLPVVETFQAAGIISRDLEDHYLGRVGFARNQPGDVLLDRADLVLTVGYDFVEYEPARWNATGERTIVHLDELASDVDNHYRPALELVGDVADTLGGLAALLDGLRLREDAAAIVARERRRLAGTEAGDPDHDDARGLDPVALVAGIRSALSDDTTVLCDVGSHYLYMARYFRTYQPRTLLFSNGQQTLGVALPWAIAATLARPGSPVFSVSGDGGFLFSAAELETAVRLGANMTHLIFNDGSYDMVAFQQQDKYGRTAAVELGDYDVVGFAESFGAHGHRVTRIDDLVPTILAAMAEPGPSIIDVPVDYSDNLRRLGGDLLADVLL